VLLIVGGVTGWALRDDGAPLRELPAEVDVADASARLVVRGDHSTLETRGLPRPGTGRVYQVWLMKKGAQDPQPTDALFTVSRDGTASVDVPGDIDDVQAVLVTEEPDGGSPAPTSEPIIAASLA
jgi:anti-sigma-K factor RskA